ncbi:MAG: hypothetical protein MZV63_46455 [Marinilabiliales bacterium]|nr:hypothetical protein [Marinilabiliales bacterium]
MPVYLIAIIRHYQKQTQCLITVKTGLEVDYFAKARKKRSGEYLAAISDLDYVIGSVHYLGNKTVDHGPDFYEGKSIDLLFGSYIDTVMCGSGFRVCSI